MVLAAVIAVIAVVVHLRRDAIARDIANSMLEERGFVATELKVDVLTPNRLELERLVIESASGARYEIQGLRLPLSVTGRNISHLAADGLTITYDGARDAHAMLSTTLGTVLELPVSQPGIDASVGRVSIPNLPELTDMHWSTSHNGQMLSLTVAALDVEAVVERADSGDHIVTVNATGAGGVSAGSFTASLVRDDDRFSAAGELAFSARAWLSLLRSLGLLPVGLDDLDAELHGQVSVSLDAPAPGQATVKTQLNLRDQLAATYATNADRTTHVDVTSMDTLAVDFSYPDNVWTASTAQAASVISTDGLNEVPVRISKLECQRGVICAFYATVDSQPVTWNDYTFDAVNLAVPIRIQTGDITRIRLSADSGGSFSGLQTQGLAAAQVTITGFSGTEILVDDAGWRCRIEELQLAFDAIVATNELRVSPEVFLRELDISNSGATLAANLSISAPLDGYWNDIALSLPGAAGTLSLQGEALLAKVDIIDPVEAIAGSVELQRNTETNTGSFVLADGWVSFDRARLSDYLPATKLRFDILQGTWDMEQELEWQVQNGIPEYRGSMTMKLIGIGGTYTDIAMVGLNTEFAATLDQVKGLTLTPAPVSVRLVDVGVPIENISFNYAVDPGTQTLQVENLSLDVFGGNVLADPFAYALTADTNDVMLRARSIQLQLMVDTLEFEALELTGKISGDLPVTMSGKSITINGGKLQSDAEGGSIRYRSADQAVDSIAPASGIGTVTQTLTNFEFESLSSTVDYVEGGNMKMLMRLVGVNPDLDPDQPYAFNLNLDNNIPQMLRSLRAVRSIEDILKQRTEN